MITEELLSYIKKQLELGHSEATVRKILIDHKWKDTDVEQAFSTILGAKPQNTQSNIASIMRPGFAGAQMSQQGAQPIAPTSEFSQPQVQAQQPQQIQVQPQTQFQPQVQPQAQYQPQIQPQPIVQPVMTEPVLQQPQVEVQPQVMPAQEIAPVQNNPIVQPEIKTEPTFQINPKLQQFQTPTRQAPVESPKVVEVKTEGPVFMPKTFAGNQFVSQDSQKKVQFGAVIQPTEVKEPLVNMAPDTQVGAGPVIADANSDFYKTLSKDSPETPALNTAVVTKNPDFKTGPISPEGRVIGQSMLKPKTFGPKVYGSNIQTGLNKMAPVSYGKFATPEAEENIPTLNKQTVVPIGGTSPYLYEKNRPDSVTLREAQNKMPPVMANQSSPNIIDRPAVEEPKKNSGFLKKLFIIFACFLILGGGAYAYVKFFQPGISKASKFGENFQNIYSADFEINISGPILSSVMPGTEDSTLTTSKIKAFIDVADSSNKISNFEIDIKNTKEINFNVLSSSASSYAYTTYEDFAYKNQWVQLNGPFVQSFLPSMLSGELPNGIVANTGSVLPEASSLKIRQLFSQFQFLTLTYDKGPEEIDGKEMSAYSFVLDKAAIDLYLEQVEVLAKGSVGYEESIGAMKNLISTIEVKEGTIWLDKDGLPYRLIATMNTLGTSTTSQITIQVNSYNEKKNISIPNNFVKPEVGMDGGTFVESETKDLIREIFVDLQSLANSFKATNSGSFVGVCQDTTSGFSSRFKELETISPNIMPVCRDGATGFLVGAKYTDAKYLCVDKSKITESDEIGVGGSSLSCAVSKEANTEDTYIKETITAFSNIAKAYKGDNQNSYSSLCDSQNYLIFSRGLDSAVNKAPQCLSTGSAFAVFAPLSTGEYACIDTGAKYVVSSDPRTVASCK